MKIIDNIQRLFRRRHKGIDYETYMDVDYDTEVNSRLVKYIINNLHPHSQTELNRLGRFISEHAHEDIVSPGKPHLWFGVSSTGVGNCFQCRCDVCGKTYDITDVECW